VKNKCFSFCCKKTKDTQVNKSN